MTIVAYSGCVKPGKGGKATVAVHIFEGPMPPEECRENANLPQCSKIVIPEAVVYIKYGGTVKDQEITNYDDLLVADFGGKVVFENLKRGDYYFYGLSPLGDKDGGSHIELRNRIGERELVIISGEWQDKKN